jgi:DNA-binding transcriptional LysR family regulator
MQITFSQVRGFVTVASTGSFTRAAEVLHLSQPALTSRIHQLEEALQLRLFNRNTRSLDLTEAGRELLPIFLRLVSDLEGAVVNAREHSRKANNIIRLAALPSCAATLLPALISEFQAANPDSKFIVVDAVNSNIRTMVREGQVDFGICVFDKEDVDLVLEPLFEDKLYVVFRPDHAIGQVARVTINELIAHPLILINRGSSIRHAVDKAFAAEGLTATGACEVTYMSTAVALVEAGLGIAILPSTSVEIRSPTIEKRPVDNGAFVRKLGLVRRGSAILPRLSQAFADTVIARLGRTETKVR